MDRLERSLRVAGRRLISIATKGAQGGNRGKRLCPRKSAGANHAGFFSVEFAQARAARRVIEVKLHARPFTAVIPPHNTRRKIPRRSLPQIAEDLTGCGFAGGRARMSPSPAGCGAFG